MEWETFEIIAFPCVLFLILAVICILVNLDKIKNEIEKFRENHWIHFNIWLWLAVFSVNLILFSVGLFLNNAIGHGILWFLVGGLLCYRCCAKILFMFPPRKPCRPENHLQEKMVTNRDRMCQKLKGSIIVGSIGCIVVASVFVGISYGKINKLNQRASAVLNEQIDIRGYVRLIEFDEQYRNASIIEKTFFGYKNDVLARHQQFQEYIQQYAKNIEDKIEDLEPVTKIASKEHNSEIWSGIFELELNENAVFDAAVLQHVSNYSKLIEYTENIKRLQETYKVNCSNCYGRGKISCSGCGGSGKVPVKWYSEGDGGTVSYTNYDCTACGGSGKESCYCGGQSTYIFEDER